MGVPPLPCFKHILTLPIPPPPVPRSLSAMLSRLPPTAAPSLAGALDHLASTAVDMVAPIFRAAVEAAEERLLRMHTWPGYGRKPSSAGGAGTPGADGNDVVTSTSPHVAEVVALLSDFRLDGNRGGGRGRVRMVRGREGAGWWGRT